MNPDFPNYAKEIRRKNWEQLSSKEREKVIQQRAEDYSAMSIIFSYKAESPVIVDTVDDYLYLLTSGKYETDNEDLKSKVILNERPDTTPKEIKVLLTKYDKENLEILKKFKNTLDTD